MVKYMVIHLCQLLYHSILVFFSSITVNFKQAWHKQVEIEFSATESEQEPPSNKKKYQPSSCSKSLLVNLSDESNDYDGNLLI